MLLTTLALAGPVRPPDYDPARSFAPLVDAVAPAVVTIEEADSEAPKGRAGSAFFVSEDGYVLSNHHVIETFVELQVRLPSGKTVPARLIGSDPAMDIALLKVDTEGPWSWMELADEVAVGDRVLTLGSPLGLGQTATAGIVSGTGRNLQQDRFYRSDDFIQTDAAINQGNSGGPLFDLDGRVVGMNTSIITNVNTVGFAIPTHLLRAAMDEIREHGRIRRGYVGIKAGELSETGRATRKITGGAVIRRVVNGSPAAEAKLAVGDIVLAVDGVVVGNDHDLMAELGNRKPGDTVSLSILRKDRRKVVEVSLSESTDSPPR